MTVREGGGLLAIVEACARHGIRAVSPWRDRVAAVEGAAYRGDVKAEVFSRACIERHRTAVRTSGGDGGTTAPPSPPDACPFNLPLRVEVRLAGRLAIQGVGVGQVAGPRPVVLTTSAPDASGVDVAVARFEPVR